jgi:putative ABC transport system ATP-binding protein
MGKVRIRAANNISFEINKGEFVVIVGASGAGKTTVLNMLGGMDRCNKGTIIVDNEKISSYSNNELTKYRRLNCGFVFQFYNLIPNLTAKENIELAIELSKSRLDVYHLLSAVGLENRINNFPSQLSGGEQQRVAIARALAKNPKLLLCDEPTGALDSKTGKMILELLQDTCINNNMTVVIVTHNNALIPCADRVIKLRDSMVEEILLNHAPLPVSQIEW